jgi:hypothetical protein
MLGASKVLMRHEHAFVAEIDLLGVWVALHVDVDRPIAGDEKRIAGGCNAAEASPRHNPSPHAVLRAASARSLRRPFHVIPLSPVPSADTHRHARAANIERNGSLPALFLCRPGIL